MQKKYRTYLIVLMSSLCMVLAIIAGSAVVIDPYALYREHEEYVGLNKFARLIKPQWAVSAEPEVVISGSSRAEYFFDTESLQEQMGKPVFNIALSGANIYEVRRNIEHVVAVAPVNTMIVGLDFFMFNAVRDVQPGFSEDRLAVRMNGRANPFYWAADLGATLASRDAFNEMRRAIKYRNRDTSCEGRWNLQGGLHPSYFECQLNQAAGQQSMFRAGLGVYLSHSNGIFGEFEFDTRPLPSNNMENIDRLISLAEEGRKMILYISPVHALHLEVFKKWNLWSEFENWKKILTRKVAEARAKGVRVELRDFAFVSELTSGPVFEREAGTDVAFYDTNHLNMTQRPRVQEELLGRGRTNNPISVLLTPEMLDDHLASNRAASADWNQTHPIEMAVFDELVGAAADKAAQN